MKSFVGPGQAGELHVPEYLELAVGCRRERNKSSSLPHKSRIGDVKGNRPWKREIQESFPSAWRPCSNSFLILTSFVA